MPEQRNGLSHRLLGQDPAGLVGTTAFTKRSHRWNGRCGRVANRSIGVEEGQDPTEGKGDVPEDSPLDIGATFP